MALFPAYSSEVASAPPSDTSLAWLHIPSCPPEVGQLPASNGSAPQCTTAEQQEAVSTPAEVMEMLVGTATHSKGQRKTKRKKNGKKVKKKKKKKRKGESSDCCSSSTEKEKSPSPSLPRSPRSRSRSKSSRSESNEKRTAAAGRSPAKKTKRKSRSRSRGRSVRSPRKKVKRKSRSRSRSRGRKRRSGSRSRKRSKSRSRSRRKSRSRSRRKSRSRSRKRSRSRSRASPSKKKVTVMRGNKYTHSSAEKILRSSKSVFLEGLQGDVRAEDAFFVSTEGDTNNRSLATTHYTQLASYKTRAKGELGSTDLNLNSGQRKNTARYFKKSALKTLYADATPVKRLPSTSDAPHESYVPLSLTHAEESSVKSSVASSVNSLGIYDSKTEQYISGTGGLTLEEDVESCRDAEYELWQSQAKRYNERLGKEPHNVSLWLEFVRFQDTSYEILYKGGDGQGKEGGEGKTRKVTTRALAERKVSILDTAIKKNMRSLELYFERLEVGQELWDDKKLKQEWDTVVFSFPNKMSVWHKYLAYVQTHFTSFTLASAVRTFSKCTEKLQQMRAGVFLTHAPPPDMGRCLVDVALQLAQVWRQAGHMERSLALFQALVELNLFCPTHPSAKKVPMEDRLALFEPFWDSRAARFGEEGAVGWAEVMQRRQPVQFPEVILEGMVDEEDTLLAQGGTTTELWLALETSREQRHWLPWEQDPEDCEDPERMVSLDELLPHLFTLDSQEEKFYLVLRFLGFLGVPDVEDSGCRVLPSPKKPGSRSSRTGDVFGPLGIETLHDANLFGDRLRRRSDSGNVLSVEAVGPSVVLPGCDDYYRFLCRAVQQAAGVFELEHRKYLTLLHVKLLGTHYQAKAQGGDEAKMKSLGKEIKKEIKGLLKSEEFRTCIPVYQQYGKVVEAMGHLTEAENVYVTALTVGTASGKALETTNEDFRAIMDLVLSYIHLQVDLEVKTRSGRHSNNVLQAICSLVTEGKFTAADGSPASGGNLLKAKKRLSQLQDHHSVLSDTTNSSSEENEKVLAVKAVTFLALIQLLTVGFRPACLIFESSVEKVSDPAPQRIEDTPLPEERKASKNSELSVAKRKTLESLYEGYLWVVEASGRLEHLVRDGKMPPVSLRSVLAAALKVAPENPTFLILLAQNQSWRNLISGLECVSSGSCSIRTLVSHLLPHLHNTISLITHTSDGLLSCGRRLESVLDQAVRRPPGSHCPLLWRLYLALVAATRPKGLKNLTYRALVHCPGVKSVYLDCVRLLPGMLKEVVKLLQEKGMRVRLPLEELQILTEKELEFEDEDDGTNSSCEEEEEEEEEQKKESVA